MSTHRCFALLFPYPATATDDGAQDADGPDRRILRGVSTTPVDSEVPGRRPCLFDLVSLFCSAFLRQNLSNLVCTQMIYVV